MKKKKKWKTIFRTRYDHYEYLIMFFELINASTTCQDLINDILQQYLNIFVIAYLNDILMYSKTFEKHVKHVRSMLKCLRKRDLRFKSEKCEFHKNEINYLNFMIERNEIRINFKKIEVVKKWKTSINVKKLQSFLEFVNYNRKFIKNYSNKTIFLIKLTAKNVSWFWRSKKKATFRKLQQICVIESILKMFDSKKSKSSKNEKHISTSRNYSRF